MNPPPDSVPQQRQARRLLIASRVAVWVITLGLVGMLGRVVQLQLRPPGPIAQRNTDRLTHTTLLSRRGSLLDRNGRPLAVTKLGYRLFADPQMVRDPVEFSARVAHLLGTDPALISRALDSHADRKYVVLDPLLSDRQYEEIEQLHKLAGLGTQPRPVRVYPQEPLASQLIGFVGAEGRGQEGLELALEPVLTGKTGDIPLLRDVRRRPLWAERRGFTPPRDGEDVRLSLDTVIQGIAEQELAAACMKYHSKTGELIVLDSRSGQVLAMANFPPFDPDHPGDASPAAHRNRCITDPIEPGSIFKPFIHAACTAAGLATYDTIINCENGLWVAPSGRRLRDAHGHGLISWREVLIVSSNIGMGKIGEMLGPKRMYDAVRSFGFGQRTGIGLPGESAGIVHPPRMWSGYSITSIPMGQEVGVTPMQMARGFTVFANDGMEASPSLLADDTPMLQRVLPARVARDTRYILRQVVTEGTGKRALSTKYQLWGKTGTAQVPYRGGYKPDAYTASFICGAPLDHPRIIVLCTVHEPDKKIGHFGGTVSAPAAKNVAERVLTYMGVPADVDPDDPNILKLVQAMNHVQND